MKNITKKLALVVLGATTTLQPLGLHAGFWKRCTNFAYKTFNTTKNLFLRHPKKVAAVPGTLLASKAALYAYNKRKKKQFDRFEQLPETTKKVLKDFLKKHAPGKNIPIELGECTATDYKTIFLNKQQLNDRIMDPYNPSTLLGPIGHELGHMMHEDLKKNKKLFPILRIALRIYLIKNKWCSISENKEYKKIANEWVSDYECAKKSNPEKQKNVPFVDYCIFTKINPTFRQQELDADGYAMERIGYKSLEYFIRYFEHSLKKDSSYFESIQKGLEKKDKTYQRFPNFVISNKELVFGIEPSKKQLLTELLLIGDPKHPTHIERIENCKHYVKEKYPTCTYSLRLPNSNILPLLPN